MAIDKGSFNKKKKKKHQLLLVSIRLFWAGTINSLQKRMRWMSNSPVSLSLCCGFLYLIGTFFYVTQRKNRKELSVVKNTYKDVDDYFETFEPLLFEEVKAQVLQTQDGEEASVCKMRLVMECSEADGFHILLVTYEEDECLVPNDLLLLSKEEVKGSSFPSSYRFAVVENRQSNLLRLRTYLAEEVVQITKNMSYSRTESFIQSLSNMRSLITSSASLLDKRVFTLKLCGLSTIIREYVALRSISSLPFKDLIFTAAEKSCGFGDDPLEISGPLHEFFSENLNKSQKKAIDVVGSAATLKSDALWKNLVASAEKRNRLFKVSKPMNDFFSEETLERMKVREKDVEIPGALGFEDEAPPLAANHGGNDDNDFGDGGGDEDNDAALAEED